MSSYEQFMEISLKLLDDAWPCDPCRKLSVNLINLKDEKGRMSESPRYTATHHTGGSSKLGGLTKQKEGYDPKDRFPHKLVDYRAPVSEKPQRV